MEYRGQRFCDNNAKSIVIRKLDDWGRVFKIAKNDVIYGRSLTSISPRFVYKIPLTPHYRSGKRERERVNNETIRLGIQKQIL